MDGVWSQVEAARVELAEDLSGLTPERWDVQSLCTEWRVRDVVAHLVQATEVKVGTFLTGMLTSGFNFNRYMAKHGRAGGAAPTASLLENLRGIASSRRHPPGTKPVDVLVDTVCHCFDIRRPLGMTRQIPFERVRLAADRVKGNSFPLGTKGRIAGLTLRATDSDWTTGSGPVVEGPGESLVLVMAGRKAALDDLTGEGKDTLVRRF